MSKVSPAPLDPGYSYRVDQIDKDHWHDRLPDFDDISFYQTWSYGEHSWGGRNISHLVLTKDDSVVAMAQLRIGRVPLLPAGIAYLTWGPLWRRKGQPVNFAHLRNVLRALQQEYVVRRRYLLRIFPKNVCGNEDEVKRVFCDEGFTWSPDPQQTLYVDLGPSLEEVRGNLRPKWRQTLNRALRSGLEFCAEDRPELREEAGRIIQEMMARKRFVEFGSMRDVLAVDRDLPQPLKVHFVYALADGELVAVLGWFPLGTIGFPLVGATGDRALRLDPSYPLWWLMVEYYKGIGARFVDLAGASRERNQGGYLFKSGLAGDGSVGKHYLGQFDACHSLLSSACLRAGMRARSHYRDLRRLLHKLRGDGKTALAQPDRKAR